MLTRLAVDGYRTFHDFEIHFTTPLTALIGRNGTGKSSILDVLADVGEIAAECSINFEKPVRIELDLDGQTIKLGIDASGRAWGMPRDTDLHDKLLGLYNPHRWGWPEHIYKGIREQEDRVAAQAMASYFGVGQIDVEDNEVYVTKHGDRLKCNYIGDGARSLMEYAATLNSSEYPWINLYDNFAANLHPDSASKVLQAIRDSLAGTGRQVILATHSPSVINLLYPDEIRVIETWSRDGVCVTKAARVYRPNEIPPDAQRGTFVTTQALEEYR